MVTLNYGGGASPDSMIILSSMLRHEACSLFQLNMSLAAVRQAEHPHHPKMDLPEGVVITEQQLAAIYKFLLDMNFSSREEEHERARVK